jgi:hypothetical protein
MTTNARRTLKNRLSDPDLKLIYLIVALLLSNTAFACYSPMGGPEYDALIKIEAMKESNHYLVEVPKKLKDMPHDAEIILAYSKYSPGGIPVYGPFVTIKGKVVGDKLVGEFVVERKDEKPYINVMWWPELPGMCGISAHTGFLEAQ